MVHKKKRHQRLAQKQDGVPMDLIGLCFNCFQEGHVTRDCPNPSCCLRCRRLGHHAQDCRRSWLMLGDRHSAPMAPLPLRCSRSPPSSSDITPPALLSSTDGSLSPPPICAPPTDSSLPSLGRHAKAGTHVAGLEEAGQPRPASRQAGNDKVDATLVTLACWFQLQDVASSLVMPLHGPAALSGASIGNIDPMCLEVCIHAPVVSHVRTDIVGTGVTTHATLPNPVAISLPVSLKILSTFPRAPPLRMCRTAWGYVLGLVRALARWTRSARLAGEP
jgi:hypothetical protein